MFYGNTEREIEIIYATLPTVEWNVFERVILK